MYFIAKGKCRVEIKDKFIERSETYLIPKILEPGDHFGEISMLYNCKRSASVSVERSYYLTCAKISRGNYNELLQIYPVMNNLMKEYTKMYDDPIKLFLEMSMNQIDFFQGLSQEIKTEWIFNMQLRQIEQGAMVYQLDTASEEMFVVQSGQIDILQYIKSQGNEEPFVIEKLYRGSVINHNSFLMKDGIDTDAICTTSVSVFYIHIDTINRMRQKHYDLDKALERKEMVLVNPNAKEPALDYIIKDPTCRQYYLKLKEKNPKTGTQRVMHDYKREEEANRLTVKLKNAIMVFWLEEKNKRKKKSFEQVIKEYLETKKRQAENSEEYKEERKRMKREKKERQKQEDQQRKEEAEAHLTSYINKEQFMTLYEAVLDINQSVQNHSETIDQVEKKLVDVNKMRKQKREQNN